MTPVPVGLSEDRKDYHHTAPLVNRFESANHTELSPASPSASWKCARKKKCVDVATSDSVYVGRQIAPDLISREHRGLLERRQLP